MQFSLLFYVGVKLGLSLTLTEEHKLRVFENRVLREVSGPRREELIEGWRKLHNVEFHDLY